MVQVERLRVTYGTVVALDGISFTARPGEIFGLLGPNGAGKTTCISCLSGLLKPTSGSVSVTGALGVVPQEIALYDDLSAAENLSYWGGAQRLRGRVLRDRVQQVLEQTGLADRAGPHRFQLLLDLIGKPPEARVVDPLRKLEAFITAKSRNVGRLPVEIDRVFRVDL